MSAFHEELNSRIIKYNIIDDITFILETNNSIYINCRNLPENIVFRNKGYIEISNVGELYNSIIFENDGDVYLNRYTKIPSDFKGFKNIGNVYPENLNLKPIMIRLKYHNRFNSFLYGKANIISENLSKLENRYSTNISFITPISNDEVGFLTNSKILKFYKGYKKTDIDNYFYDEEKNLYKEASKNIIKIGRLVKKLLPLSSDVEIEEFVNLYKATFDETLYEMEIIKGENIRKYYDRANQDAPEYSQLYKSCYNYITKEDTHNSNGINLYKQLEFYVRNPNIGLLILKEKNAEKICGRALMWFDKNGGKFIDNAYCKENNHVVFYTNYASKNNCISYNNGDSYNDIHVDVPEELKNLEVIPEYLDCLYYLKSYNIITGNTSFYK